MRRMGADDALQRQGLDLHATADGFGYSYVWNWLGVPIIQVPPDVVAMQEIIWENRPQVIVETGVARGGSIIFSASMLQLIGEGTVVGIDIDIRAHNREAIEGHPLAHRVQLIEGSSIDASVIEQVRAQVADADRVMVVLDSNHTHEHVLEELHLYGPLVTPGQFLVVADTVVEYSPAVTHTGRPWGVGNSPKSALDEYLKETDRFEVDEYVNGKLLVTSSPGGYLRCVK